MKYLNYIILSSIGITIILATFVFAENSKHNHVKSESQKSNKVSFWTCSMHPQIMLPKNGECPICGMNLIPVTDEMQSDPDVVRLKLSKNAERLASIQTTKVVRKKVIKKIRLVGAIDFDETKLTHITAWVPGRIERMFVDYTGIKVQKGDHMLELYSPDLISAQEELIQVNKSFKKLRNSSSTLVTNSTERALKASEEKLILLGLTKSQVNQIKVKAKVEDRVTIFAPTGGIVVDRNATEGMYVKEGSRIYSIADLKNLWVYLDAYETDLPWIHYGQKVIFTTQALPGIKFEGIVSFISPVVDSKTRTTKIRVNVDNSDSLLKPGLFVNGIVQSTLYSRGEVFEASLKGKNICPMHPEIIQNEPGKCSICGMNLVKAEELGVFKDINATDLPLIIPITAVLHTGKRSIVYVKNESEYEFREVVLGPKTDNFYIVESGLREGELVVSNGAFKIDADLQIKGKKSMMNPDAIKPTSQHNHGNSKKEKSGSSEEVHSKDSKKTKGKLVLLDSLKNLVESYLNLSEALASDDESLTKKSFNRFKEIASKQTLIMLPSTLLETKEDINSLRESFGELTTLLIPVIEKYKLSAFKAYCPMALNGKGGFWLQRNREVRNPYFGASMLNCGSIEGEL